MEITTDRSRLDLGRIHHHPDDCDVRRTVLVTADAAGLYAAAGFAPLEDAALRLQRRGA